MSTNTHKKIKIDDSIKNTKNIKYIAEKLLGFYESSLDTVTKLINSTHSLLEEYKNERSSSNEKLQNVLAKEKSFRKKDFEHIINQILPLQQEKENCIKKSLENFLIDQKRVAESIKKRLSSDGKIQLDEFKEMLHDVQNDREKREKEVRCMLEEFRNDYKKMSDSLRSVLRYHKSIRIRDVKSLMKSFEKDRELRKAKTTERAKEWKETAKSLSCNRSSNKPNNNANDDSMLEPIVNG